jgi:signal transduction histidine kinase/putative methionine-R-sulfoxide reductase with GAF domain
MRPKTERKKGYEERVRQLSQDLESRNRQLAILAAVASRVHGLENASCILETALKEILSGLGLTAAWVFLGDQKAGKLRLAAAAGLASSYLKEIQAQGLGECLCPEVFSTGHRMQARNTVQCPRMPTLIEGLTTPVAHACVPLQLEGDTRGVLNVAARPGEQFSDDELRFLETLGHQVCIAVERAEHLQREQRHNQEARALAAISKAIGGSLDAEAILGAVGETAREILGADRVHVLLGADPRRMRVAHLSGLPHPELSTGASLDLVAIGAQGQARALAEREPFWATDWSSDNRVNTVLARRWGIGSAIAVPLVARNQTLGLLVVSHATPQPWAAEQVDIAEALGAQASVALDNARLYEEAREAYRDLKAAQQKILQAEKMAVLGTFASGLAHEVRNPLNSITLQLAILGRRASRLEPDLANELEDLLAIIRQEIKRLDALVGDFLIFSRSSRLQFAQGNLGTLVDDVARLLLPEAEEAGITLRRQTIGDRIPDLAMDSEKMKQVLINLMRNAIEAMPDGGTIVLETGVLEGVARVSVEDTGPGLPEGLDVFELFVTTKAKGTGLGLPIAQQILAQHGGDLSSRSEPGKGAAFTITLPLGTALDETVKSS